MMRIDNVLAQKFHAEIGPISAGSAGSPPDVARETLLSPSRDAMVSIDQICMPGDLVFDIGANVGAKAEAFVKRGMRVVCFEPQPACQGVMAQKFRTEPRVTVVGKGVASKPGVLELSICEDARVLSTFSDEWKTGRFANYRWATKIPVDVITLDSAVLEFGRPRYCKIDVEGFEIEVLNGLSAPAGILSFEFTREFAETARKCVDRCVAIGYRYFNVAIAEEIDFRIPQWCGPAMLFSHLDAIKDDTLWGDIYASV